MRRALVVLALQLGCRRDCPPPPVDAAPLDAGVDACVCPPHWPTCPSGCMPPPASNIPPTFRADVPGVGRVEAW